VGASHPHKQEATAKIKALPFTLFLAGGGAAAD